MTKQKILFSVGIPAYNEEANIGNLLRSVLSQQTKEFALKEIIVISDGSSDGTGREVKRVKDARVKFVDSKVRLGKAERLNQILHSFKTDFIILLDADNLIVPGALYTMIKSLSSGGENLGLVCGQTGSISSDRWVSKALRTREDVLNNIVKAWKGGKNIYAFRGTCLGLSKKFAKSLKIPSTSGNDAYIYLAAKKAGYKVEFINKTLSLYVLPRTLADHLKQSTRFKISKTKMEDYYGKSIRREYAIPKKLIIQELLKELVLNPFYLMSYLCLLLYSYIFAFIKYKKSAHDGIWSTSNSTKKIVVN